MPQDARRGQQETFFARISSRAKMRTMPCLHQPSSERLHALLESQRGEPLSYTYTGRVDLPPPGAFIVDDHRAWLGEGEAVWRRACVALDAWVMFPEWAVIHGPGCATQEPGTLVAMVTRICGLWWINPCRILRRVDSDRTHGFVYGTLPGHAECGEELFAVERDAHGGVWYVIRAFSRPRHWMAWLGFPLARWWQLRFVRDSKQRMQEAAA